MGRRVLPRQRCRLIVSGEHQGSRHCGPPNPSAFSGQILNRMEKREKSVNASNPEHLFNNLVHEDKIAEFCELLLSSNRITKFQAFPIGSRDSLPLSQIVQRLADEPKHKGEVNWRAADSSPFSINSDAAIKLGYKPISTSATLDLWMRDLKK